MFTDMKPTILFLAFAACVLVRVAEAADCGALARQAEEKGVTLAPPNSDRVTGTGRLFFHTAPDAACRDPKVFVIPKDTVTAYSEYQGYSYVMYLNPNTLVSVNGWVESKRLAFEGSVAPYSPK